MSAPTTTYDELPYDCGPMSATHPDNLAAVATLYGMTPPDPARCRVLELGCGTGGNLLALAVSLPHAHFTGVDLSRRQIADGTALIEKMILTNVELKAMSLLDMDDSFGQYDYVIAHGIYSWVPPAVQDKILQVCADNLAPDGVAYVSYNTYPGWHQRGMVREMMSFHTREFADPRQRVEQARALLSFLVEGYPKVGNQTYRQILADEQRFLAQAADTYLFHEHLEEVNLPVYFHEFMERAHAKKLQFLSEAKPNSPLELFSAPTLETLKQIVTDILDLEQYLDFLHNRTFRKTLLCHQDRVLNRAPTAAAATKFRFSSFAEITAPDADTAGDSAVVFRGDVFKGVTNQTMVKTALAELMRVRPGRLTFDELFDRVWEQVRGHPGAPPTADEARTFLGGAMLSCHRTTLVWLHVTPQPFTLTVSERPQASALARLEAATSAGFVSTLAQTTVRLEVAERLLLTFLDGTNDLASLEGKCLGR